MKAIVLTESGDVDKLVLTTLPVPVIVEGEVLIQVKAISINPVDAKTRTGKGLYGKLKEQPPIILGWDVSGIITESKSQLFKVGDEVFGMVNFPGHGKAYAEYAAATAVHLALKPANISHEEAAAATLAALTAWQVLVNHAKIKATDKVLIHAAAGGVGHYAVQIAKHIGAYVIGTSSAKNKDFVIKLGADEHIDYKSQRFEDAAEDLDLVLDTIGGDNIDRSLEVIKTGGTIISIPSGLNEEVTAKASAKGINGYFILVASNGDDMKQLAILLEKGIIKSHVSQTYAFEQLPEAHSAIESGRTVGKIVITV
ncbi:NADPH:quinone reductase-like Zn-dependent oxidoreductase [Pedobacter cryoconitis]|uniref:NADPH:quinone reductase-like Zn-dependent oxidoreductase n=1 Tax=Pedobacter cryoconitis TaxID=188932 RepID=A0A7W8YY62_9SPHI|nr:NADP-dependent oxidoreductase [Pedobacter cryoconitis]MBB5623906.1 NADPH:quinone reductase-like Zn-dependent oxidoreductase [Pedobacter cryoconitis]